MSVSSQTRGSTVEQLVWCEKSIAELEARLAEAVRIKSYWQGEAVRIADERDKAQAQLAERNKLLRECKKVMKADNLHRGNPDRRSLWNRLNKTLAGNNEGKKR